jgi:hypothetical protein
MSETREQVFAALLAAWWVDESALIGEFSSDFDKDQVEVDRKAEEWRRRYEEAA